MVVVFTRNLRKTYFGKLLREGGSHKREREREVHTHTDRNGGGRVLESRRVTERDGKEGEG